MEVTQHFLELLKKSDEPRIVNVSSDLASLSNHKDPEYPFYEAKVAAYCSSKTALNAFTVMLSHELKNKTRFKINSVNPAFTATDLNHFTGTQTIEQGANAIVKYTTIGNDGPTGGFFDQEGEIAW
ncbi:SDR family NAD(P)-dependent oxidoreductase [Flavobacterium sp. FlaQc-47]|uniref:SDR family NAD(P)-dependent oxidoreductase n=1 Tax=Flavobacterium sp. FlaQc-47 TaxID=3374180 RepID=UPI0037570152